MMKKNLVILLLCFCAVVAHGHGRKLPSLKFTHLTGNFYLYVSYGSFNGQAYPANALYLVTSKGIVLFDTPWDESYYQPLLDSLWIRHHKKVIMCIATHFHTDRTGGLKYFADKGIKTYTTRQTDSLCLIHHDHRAKYLIPEDTTFYLAGYHFQTWYPGPGHTIDNIVIWFPQAKILYGGCLIKSVEDTNLGNLEDANVKQWASSLRRVQKRFPYPAYVIVGHNDWKDKHAIQHTIDMAVSYNKSHP